MKVNVTGLGDLHFVLEVSEDLDLGSFKAVCGLEIGLRAEEISLLFNGTTLLDNSKSLHSFGIKEFDLLLIKKLSKSSDRSGMVDVVSRSDVPGPSSQNPLDKLKEIDFSQIKVPSTLSFNDNAYIEELIKSNPPELQLLKKEHPELSKLLSTGEEGKAELFKLIKSKLAMLGVPDERRIRLLTQDPLNPEAQQIIADEIRRNNIDANMEAAYEFNPEIFGTVCMLYINCKVNGHHVKAFVDSGAQTTIMSEACADKYGLVKLLDKRWHGIAKGVGTQKIVGKIHLVDISIEQDHFATSISILDNQVMDLLIGLDVLKRYQCSIDLKKNVLRIGTTGTETPFLPESELPEYAKLSIPLSKIARADSSMDNNFDEEIVQDIIALGFPRDKVIAALSNTNGNKTEAVANLFKDFN